MMPAQAPQWTEFLSCPICYMVFNEQLHKPISLACGHTVCKRCLQQLHQRKCPFDQNLITKSVTELPVNFALLQLVGVAVPDSLDTTRLAEHSQFYDSCKRCIEELAMYLKPMTNNGCEVPTSTATSSSNSILSRPMQRKLVTLVNCQLVEEEGRARAMRAVRSLGERITTELILQHQNPQQLSSHLWAAVRARGCQFLGPAMQEEVLRLILLALEDGSALSRKVLVLFVVQRLESQYPQASKTAIGHVVQLLYRASCFKVTKREKESSLMQLKEDFCNYEALRREHDSQVVQIATEAGLRISPEQWSSLLYGDNAHKSHMQSIIDKLQSPQSFSQSVSELVIVLQRSGDVLNLSKLRPHLDLLGGIDPNPDVSAPSWENLDLMLQAGKEAVEGLAEYMLNRNSRKQELMPANNPKYKTSMCRDLAQKGRCPRGEACTFAHSTEELERYRQSSKRGKLVPPPPTQQVPTSASLTASERRQLEDMSLSAESRITYSASSSDGEMNGAESPPIATEDTVTTCAPGPVMTPIEAEKMGGCSNDRLSVAVPVMKPSCLTMGMKTSIAKQTIYSSPASVPSKRTQSLSLLPISKKAPSLYRVTPSAENQMYMPNMACQAQHLAKLQKACSPTISHASVVAATSEPTCHPPPTSTETVPSSRHTPRPSEATVRNTVMMPPNPYTNSKEFGFPTPDSHYYLPKCISMATRGRSPSQHLQELHVRRKELLSQLSDTQKMGVSVSSPMNSSVADSMATSHSVISLNNMESSSGSHPRAGVDFCTAVPMAPISSPSQSPTVSHSSAESVLNAPHQSGEYIRSSWDLLVPSEEPELEETSGVEEYDYLSRCDNPGIEDEFIPFEHTYVSKYGPISRMAKVKTRNSTPVQVTAVQGREVRHVTSVTPMSRPYPMPSRVPSRYDDMPYNVALVTDHMADPAGSYVATSLPTALLQPNKPLRSGREPVTLWSLKEKMLNSIYGDHVIMPNVPNPLEERSGQSHQIQVELECLDKKITNLKLSEDVRLARELQAVELNIQETRRQMHLNGHTVFPDTNPSTLARDLQVIEESRCKDPAQLSQEAQRKLQVAQDRQIAEQMVIDEALMHAKHITQ